ncbi:penicillin-binding protein 2, partial [Candidatus Parcubacteria bacterium]|nr:penicillin-binding protein 2 [Candidatus Parcubacteria bacterium]
GKILEERDAAGNPIVWGEYHRVSPQHGRDLILTLDRAVQFLVEEESKEAVAKYGALSGTVIILDPKTGAVWAMANYPSFDPAELVGEGVEGSKGSKGAEGVGGEEETGDERRNLAIAATFEPGSVMKMITMSAGIDTGQITPQTTFYDAGPLTISGHTVDTWDGKHYGEESMIEVLQHSNNVGAAWVAQQLGVSTLREYLLKFGLGKSVGIDLEGEDTGVVKDASEWRAIDLATAAFGQGISATPLQVASAFAVVANDGVLMRPYLVARILDGDKAVEIQPQKVRRVLSSDNAEVILKMLEAAVEGGESRFYNLPNYKVAGKTGTAQIPREGRYDPRKTNATFVGFFAKSRKFVMLVKLEEPSSSIYAAETAVPTWMQIAKRLALYWGVEPDH